MASEKKNSLHLLLCFVAAGASCLEKKNEKVKTCGEEMNERANESRKKKFHNLLIFFFLKKQQTGTEFMEKVKKSIKRFCGCDLKF